MDKSKSNPSWVCVLTYPFLFVIRCRYCGFDPLFCVMVVLRVLIWTPNLEAWDDISAFCLLGSYFGFAPVT